MSGEPPTADPGEILDALLSHVAVLDGDGRIVTVNAAWRSFARANGLRDEEHGVGQDYFAVCERAMRMGCGDGDAVAKGLRDVIRGRASAFWHQYPCHSPTEERWFQVRATPFTSSGGALVVHERVTELQLAERDVIEQRNLAESIIEALPGAFFIVDLDGGLTRWNRTVETVTGLSPDALRGRRAVDFVAPGLRERARDAWRRLPASGPVIHESQVATADGGRRPVLFAGRVTRLAGRPVVIGMGLDIRRQKAAEAELRRLNAELELRSGAATADLRTIADMCPDGIFAIDEAGRVSFASPAASRLTGLPVERLEGLSLEELDRLFASLCAPGETVTPLAEADDGSEEVFVLERPERHIVRRFIRTVSDDGRSVHGRVAYLRDVTGETELDRLKTEFITTAAHELRTPLANVYGYTELLLMRQFEPQEQQEFLQIIADQAQHLVRLVGDLLDLTRLQADGRLNLESTDVRPIVEEIARAFTGAEGARSIEVSLPRRLGRTHADPRKLRQILTNVLDNACKYSDPASAVGITVAERRRDGARYVTVAVADTGMGMTEEQLARVTERFWRADAGSSVHGAGLGMALVHELVELHGGILEIESRYGHGTEVTVWLPIGSPKKT